MSRSRSVLLSLAVLTFIMLSMMQAQGLYWESTTTGKMREGKPIISKSYYMPKMYMEARTSQDRTSIVRLDEQKIYDLNNQEKTYSEMTFDEINAATKKMGSAMDARMAEMKKRMEQLPPEQRKMAEQMMKQYGAGGADKSMYAVDKTGEKKTISGYDCTKYVIKRNDEPFMTLWTTKSIPGYESVREDMKSLSSKLMLMNPQSKGVAGIMGTIEGFPIQTEIGNDMVTTVTKIVKQTTPAKEFEVPSGYKKVKSPLEDSNKEMEGEKSDE